MARPDVVRHEIQNDLHPFAVCGDDQMLQIGQRSKVLFDSVFIHGAIAVVVLLGRVVVVHDRRQPDCGHTEVFQVVEVIADAAQVAAMISARFCAVVVIRRFRRMIVRGVAIRKSIRHNQIQNIIGTQSLKTTFRAGPLFEGEGINNRRCSWNFNVQGNPARFRVARNFQPQEKIATSGLGAGAQQAHTRIFDRNFCVFQRLAGDQQRQIRFQPHPPVRRLHTLYFWLRNLARHRHCRTKRSGNDA